MATLYVTLQGKGGVGKELFDLGLRAVADRHAESNPVQVRAAEGDPPEAVPKPVNGHHVIDPRALDTLVGIVAEAPDDGQVVVDVGSNGASA